jgi:hypothetical protein
MVHHITSKSPESVLHSVPSGVNTTESEEIDTKIKNNKLSQENDRSTKYMRGFSDSKSKKAHLTKVKKEY